MTAEYVIVSPFFHPEPISTGKYNGAVAAALAARGHDVKVICSYPIYPDWQPSDVAEEMPGVTTYRGGRSLRYPTKAVLRRALLELWFSVHVARTLRKAWCGGTIVAVMPPSLFMLALTWVAGRKARVIGLVHDLQDVYADRKPSLPGRVLGGAIRWVEGKAFRACDRLVFLSESMRQRCLETHKLDPARSTVQYPFVSPDLGMDDGNTSAVDHLFDPGRKAVVYSGALGEKQAPDKLVALMIAILDHYPEWQARIFSQGPVFERLKASHAHERLAFLPLVAPEHLPALLRRSDVQVIPQESGTSEGSLTSKLPNLIASSTRILCITDAGSELKHVVSEYEAGQVATSWDVQHCLDAFRALSGTPRAAKSHVASLLGRFSISTLLQSLEPSPAR
jgi:colanic acid biosynthesis glycosyl transferase WcaI